MSSISAFLPLAHLIGLALGIGSATAKVTLLLKSMRDPTFTSVYLRVIKPLTRQIILGLILLTLSGIVWLIQGYPFSRILVVKLILVALLWGIGPIIDHVFEPRFEKLAPAANASPSDAFMSVRKSYLAIELFGTGLFYAVIVMWVLAEF